MSKMGLEDTVTTVQDHFCGSRCAWFMLEYYAPFNRSQNEVIESLQNWSSLAPVTVAELQSYLHRNGLNAVALDLPYLPVTSKFPGPLLVLTNQNDGAGGMEGHYLIVLSKNDLEVNYWDGLRGRGALSESDFANIYTGTAIAILPRDSAPVSYFGLLLQGSLLIQMVAFLVLRRQRGKTAGRL